MFNLKVLIYGAGSIGCYIGAILHRQGIETTLLGRPQLQAAVSERGGIQISDYEGRDEFVADVPYSTDPSELATADVVLVTLKCTAMEGVAKTLAQYCQADALIVCLQNGVGAEQPVVNAVTQAEVLCGIVPFNVVQNSNAHFHRATEGPLHLPNSWKLHAVQHAFMQFGLGCKLESDMPAIVWGKLLLNLNNAINALSDLPLKQELSMRGYRLVLAKCQEELLAVCKAKGIHLAKLTAVKPALIPIILKLPDWLFGILAQKMLAIDPQARSSMWEDVQAGRKTEIDFLNGAVVRFAAELGLDAPANKLVSEQLKLLSNGQIQPPVTDIELRAFLNG